MAYYSNGLTAHTSSKKQLHNNLGRGLMIRISYATLGLLVAALASFSTSVFAADGTMQAQFQVTPDGGASYVIPISAPPGTAGMQPDLRIEYSSNSGNGVLGVGWQLSGLSRITRCPASLEPDGFIDPVDYDSNDRLCLDGQKLVVVSGTYGRNNAQYRTEIESFSKIVQHGNLNSSSSWFEVWSKDGRVAEYGHSNDSAVITQNQNQQQITVWAVNRIADRSGNYMSFSYRDSNGPTAGGPEIGQIDYSANDAAGVSPGNSIKFLYAGRYDSAPFFYAGESYKRTARLSKVITHSGSTPVSSYELRYAHSSIAPAYLTGIAGIRQCGERPQRNCLPWTNFDRSIFAGDYTQPSAAIASSSVNEYSYEGLRETFLDLNGDGLTDRVWMPEGRVDIWAALSNRTGLGAPRIWLGNTNGVNTKSYNGNHESYSDLNGDGLPDKVWIPNGQQNIYAALSTGSAFNTPRIWLPRNNPAGVLPFSDDGKHEYYADVNGDGRNDRVWIPRGRGDLWVALSNGNEFGTPEIWLANKSTGYSNKSSYAGHQQVIDVNADGMGDWVWFPSGRRDMYVALSTGNGFAQPKQWLTQSGFSQNTASNRGRHETYVDLNGDGLLDYVWVPYETTTLYAAISTGTSFSSPQVWLNPTASSVNILSRYGTRTFYVDLNADGLTDRVWNPDNTSDYYVAYSSGKEFKAPELWLSSSAIGRDARSSDGKREAFVDVNGDGIIDRMWIPHGQTALVLTLGSNETGEDMPPNLITRITDGLEKSINIDYKPLTDLSVHTRSMSASYPNQSIVPSQHVVAAYERPSSDGSSQARFAYKYSGLEVNLRGRGGRGFAKVLATRSNSIVGRTTTYAQDFPYTGMVESDATHLYVVAPNITVSNNTLDSKIIGSGSAKRYFPYVKSNKVTTYPGTWFSSAISEVVTDTSYDNYGSPSSIKVTTYAGTNPTQDRHETLSSFLYSNNTSNWILGRLLRTTVKKSTPSAASQTRRSDFTYTANGLLKSETIEPGSNKALTTAYSYDAFGNKIKATVSGPGISTRISTTGYDSQGRFPIHVTNALGHTETRSFDPKYGNPITLTGPNLKTTSWTYDPLGRLTRENRADGTYTNTSYSFCSGSQCPTVDGKFAVLRVDSSGSQVQTVINKQEQEVSRSSRGYDGTWIHTFTQYDALDRVLRQSQPVYDEGTVHWTSFRYDNLNRITGEERAANQYTSGGTFTTYNYNGLITRQTDPGGMVTVTVKNVIGQTVQVTDPVGGILTNAYDAFGNLVSVSDPANNVTSMTYDLRGHKVAMTDPDLGHWTYEHNALGELVKQIDAKDQEVTLEYDLLGRLIARHEPEGDSSWTYDTRWVGAISDETGPTGYLRQSVYDTLGRIKVIHTRVDGVIYNTRTTYDQQSRPEIITYPSGYQVRQVYNTYGYMTSVEGVTTNETFWQLNYMDALGNVSVETLGNGVSTLRSYDQSNGMLDTVIAGKNNGWEVQSLNYQWDVMNRLQERVDQNQGGLVERFQYDNLNRLVSSTLNNMNNLSISYDALGNITQKSGVGSYHYDGAPHAVSRITGGARAATYTYDGNGNMLAGANRSMTWTSYNKPRVIEKGAGSRSEFYYGPDRARYKQIVDDSVGSTNESESIVYIGNLYERHAKATGVVEQQHFIRAAGRTVAIYTARSNNANDLRYLHRDHLGSVDAITNETGSVVERFSYDPHGKRRGLAWTEDNNDDLLTLAYSTDRGFTGHEHLDHLALIHMNGRVFDPVIGRFISADPYVQFANNTQSYNRYSYVLNNLLSATDPSGFFLSGLTKKIKKFVKKVAKVAVRQAQTAFFVGPNLGPIFNTSQVRGAFRDSQTLQQLGRFVSGSFGPFPAAGFEGYLAQVNGSNFFEALVSSGFAYVANGGGLSARGASNSGLFNINAGLGNVQRNQGESSGGSQDVGGAGGSANGASTGAMANAVGERGRAGGLVAAAGVAAVIDGPAPVGDLIAAGILVVAGAYAASEITYATYTKTNPATGEVYSGRASGFSDPLTVVAARDRTHARLNGLGFGPAVIDRAIQGIAGRPAIRGREQQLIDSFGGVGDPRVANRIRGVSRANPFGRIYNNAADSTFGSIAPYTGF